MSDPQHRPVPGPVPGPRPLPGPPAAAGSAAPAAAGSDERFADLPARPVVEHVGVFEAELERLQRELSTIDQL